MTESCLGWGVPTLGPDPLSPLRQVTIVLSASQSSKGKEDLGSALCHVEQPALVPWVSETSPAARSTSMPSTAPRVAL